MPVSSPQALRLEGLRATLARLERPAQAAGAGVIPLCPGISLPDGGLVRAALHEVVAADPGVGAGFAATLLGRAGGTVIWITLAKDELLPWPAGLARQGLDPGHLVVARADRWADALWAMEESLRCPGLAGALLVTGWEKENRLDLTATRRLQLAAEAGGGLGLLLRPDRTEGGATATVSRWRVSALPSGLTAPRWQLELLRIRGGAPAGPWPVTWQEATGELVLDEALPLARRALP